MTVQRRTTIRALTWDHVDFQNGFINFENDVGKKHPATVPINSQALLEAHKLRKNNYVVKDRSRQVSNTRKPITSATAQMGAKALNLLVGVAGFEPATPSPPVKCATRLRHTPTVRRLFRQIGIYSARCVYAMVQETMSML